MSKQRRKDAKEQEQRKQRKKARQEQKAKREATIAEVRDTTFIIQETPAILIVCEGKNTEPSYFGFYKALIPSVQLEIDGAGKGHQALVDYTKRMFKRSDYHQIWCVFDREDERAVSIKQFNNAVSSALQSGFMVAYSNQTFEYWLLLHFNNHQGAALSRDTCSEKLNDALKLLTKGQLSYDYKGDKKISEILFKLMRAIDPTHPKELTFQQQALQRAETIHQAHLNGALGTDPASPATQESSTTVYQLVNELNQYTF